MSIAVLNEPTASPRFSSAQDPDLYEIIDGEIQ